jgi:peptidoglycan/xylan/chitin deacetylase (PgdA/CDA1 family)
MIPHRTPFVLPLVYPSLMWRAPSSQKILYLTFDDGPVPGPTEYVLDVLNERSVKATFFCIGDNIRKHPDVFRQVLTSGHTIGNHTVNHLNGWRTNADEYVGNVNAFNGIATEAGMNGTTTLFRPPYGRITGRQIRMLSDFRIVMWDVLSQDYNSRLSPGQCLHRTIGVCRPGSIIVFHDSYKSQRNMQYALPLLIDHFLNDGYRFDVLESKAGS